MRALLKLVAVLGVFTLTAALAQPAFAHEERQVGGYHFLVGWLHEPTYAGVENGVQVTITDAKNKPVDDLGSPATLKVEVLNGTQKSDTLELVPSFDPDSGEGTHGQFNAAIVPTRPGDYTFHFFGTVGAQNVDEKFTSSDKTFDTVKEPSAIEFPVKDPSPGQLATSIDRLTPRLASAQSLAQKGKDKASTAGTLGIVGIVIGALGLLVGLTAMRRSMRPRA